MNDILLIGNDVEFSGKHKGVFETSFSKKYLGEAAYILSIKIYRDISRCLIRFFSKYIPWQEFEVVQNGTDKDMTTLDMTKNIVKVYTHWKILSSVLIYLYRSWCPICKQLHRGISLKNSFKTLLYAFQKILHHFRSTICHSQILIRKVVVLPLTFL